MVWEIVVVSALFGNGASAWQVNKNSLLGGQFLIFLPKKPGK